MSPVLAGARFEEALSGVDRPAAEALGVELVESEAAFRLVRGEWNALLGSSGAQSIFSTWEWLHTWWAHFGLRRGLRLFLVRRGTELVGGLALASRPRGLLPAAPVLEFVGAGDVGSDYLDIVARRGLEDAVARALGDHLEKSGSILRFERLPPSSVADRLVSVLVGRGWKARVREAGVCPFIPLGSLSFEGYLESLGASHRSNFRRRLRALRRMGALAFTSVRKESERQSALDMLVSLHNQRWSERGGSNALQAAGLVRFHREWTRLALEEGWLRLFLLTLDERPVAALYGLRYRDTFLFYQAGFDTRWSGMSVGLVAMGLAIESAIEEKAGEFDLLHGDEAYKRLWARQTRPLRSVELFPSPAMARLYGGAADLSARLRGAVRSALPSRWASRVAAVRRLLREGTD